MRGPCVWRKPGSPACQSKAPHPYHYPDHCPPPTPPQVFHVLNKAPETWDGGVGFITKDILRQRMPPAADDVMVLRCGPKPMNDAMKGHLDELGYAEDAQFEF
jgi:NAD(P)H-flavin reductase